MVIMHKINSPQVTDNIQALLILKLYCWMIPVSLKLPFSQGRNTHCLFSGGLLLGLLAAQPHKVQSKVRTTCSGVGEQSGHSNDLDWLQHWVTSYSLTVNHYIWYRAFLITLFFSTPCFLSGSLKKDLGCKKKVTRLSFLIYWRQVQNLKWICHNVYSYLPNELLSSLNWTYDAHMMVAWFVTLPTTSITPEISSSS